MEELPDLIGPDHSVHTQETKNGSRITRSYLETLTTGDLIRMADSMGVDIPLDLDRIFIIEELLELDAADSDDSGDPALVDMKDTVFVESAPLPKQYNITFIEMMIRDPLWAFVFWEIKAQEKEQFEKAPDFDGYYLKVVPSNKSAKPSPPEGVFTIPVKPEDTAWYLGLSEDGSSFPERGRQSQFTVELCVSIDEEETVLAVSNPVTLPELPEVSAGAEKNGGASENPLIRLSGYGDFHILRRNERLLRAKRGAGSGGESRIVEAEENRVSI